jgi:hypothetical protein
VITLVGQGINSTPGVVARVTATLRNVAVIFVPDTEPGLKLSLIVPQPVMKRCVELLHREFFQSVDPTVFASVTEISRPAPVSAAQPNSIQSAEMGFFPRPIRA